METPIPQTLRPSVVVSVGLMLGLASCSHSEPAAESSESTASSTSTGASQAETSSGAGASSDAESTPDYAQRPELKELEGETKRLKARAEILKIKNKIQSNFLLNDSRELPEELSELTEGENPVISDSRLLRDPWDRQYIYRNDGESGIELFSAGPDGKAGTDDDVRP